MIYQKRIQLTKLALALSVVLAGAPALAQNTTSAVAGRISGADGKPAAGASVQIIHTESGSVSTVTTDAEGRYSARGLRTGGPYTIIITKNGETERREGVFLQLAETATVDATVGAQMQTVTVAGNRARADIFNRNNMGAGTSISNAQLQTQASINRNLQDYARADPRVSQTDKERGEISVAGQNSRYNSMTVDGVAINDTFGLEANGSPTARQPISIEAIQSVQVNVANYDVTQKGYTGGNINAVTKSGTNKWRGGAYYVYRNDKLAGDRYNTASGIYSDPPKFDETTKGIWASGPIIQDKLFFYALTEETSSSRSAPDFGYVGQGSGSTVGVTQSEITRVQNLAKSRYGLDLGSTVAGGGNLSSREQMFKVDWNISDNHRANVRYQRTSQSEPIFPGFSATGVSLSSYLYQQNKEIETVVAQVFSDWTPTFSTEFKASSRDYDSVPKNNARLPTLGFQFSGPLPTDAPSGTRTGNRFLNAGTENSRQQNVLGTRTQDYYGGANWTVGDHEIKFGADYQKNKIYNAFLQNVYGNYTFACDNNFSYSFGSINCSSASLAQVEAAVLENFQRGRPSSYTLQSAAAGYTLNDAVAAFTMDNTGLFLQDTWNLNRQLTLNYGFRVDKLGVDKRPLRNAAVAAPLVANAAGVRQTGGFGRDNTVTADGQKLFQPRVGFNYRFDTPRLMQVRGGAGLFQGAAAAVWMSNPFQNAGIATRTITCSTSGAVRCPNVDGTFSINPDTQPSVTGAPSTANVDLLDPSLRQPSVWKANLAFETELPWYGLVAGAEYLYTHNKDGIYYQNLNLGKTTATGSDGRPMFWNATGGLLQRCWVPGNNSVTVASGCTTTAKALNNISYGNVLLATGTDKGESRLQTVSLSYPMTKGMSWSVAATHTFATEVSNLSSSTSSSNYGARSSFNPNEDIAANSSYLVKNRVNATINFEKNFFQAYKTRFGLFYEGRTGKPYSWTFKNDLNGDGISTNDLMYIPKSFGSGEVTFAGDTATSHANEQRFWDVVNANKALRNAAGGVVGRNSDFAPWTNSVDLRLSQEIPGLFARNKGTVSFDIFNVGNLLNKKWGHINEVPFSSSGGYTRGFVDYAGLDAQGHYVYSVRTQVDDYAIRQVKGESQWAAQVTLKYEF
ncbi:TonB-dependent receptor plug domain-containing protein [Massilia forsythiae]|uniref:TonB-dependent receptor plug domain-containing protein n=1 Tax=Massilia forsythiae TaxID=2728020 RepID=A0A7Z2VU09_9BURK|nr:carboxypeptidase regulatory-like domain-containing protein [Massilia forsythiae]QJD99180.1 TonB-dependent receptor plug domain-containing protein [Massilia forsythiae]